MQLLSGVATKTREPTLADPTIGDTIKVGLNDGNVVNIRASATGPKPKIAVINGSFIPYIPGNGNFIVNEGNAYFYYGNDPTDYALCIIAFDQPDVPGFTRAEYVQQIAEAIRSACAEGANWGDGLDINTTIDNDALRVDSTKCTLYQPFFDDNVYWTFDPAFQVVVGANSINNAGAGDFTIKQRFLGGSFPRGRGAIQGRFQGAGEGTPDLLIKITELGADGPFVTLSVSEGNWIMQTGAGDAQVFDYTSGDDFKLSINGHSYELIVDDVVVASTVDFAPRLGTSILVDITVAEEHQLSEILMTTLPTAGGQYFDEMTEDTTSWIEWASEALQTMVGSGTKTVQGTVDTPSVITCSSPLKANGSIGNILVCLDLQCKGSQSGPISAAYNQFIYTIPNVTQNLDTCTVIAPVLLPIDLNYGTDQTLSRIQVQFISQITGQPVGFTAPASITLAFID